jgi:sulfate adenylyltransferase subunit 2
MARDSGMELIVHRNPEAGRARHQSLRSRQLHTDLWKTEGLKQALDAIRLRRRLRRRAARRGKEPRQGAHLLVPHGQPRWDPKNQRPNSGALQHAQGKGESIRVFPLSNWTELDIWQYIHLRTSRSCRCTSPRPGRWWSATAR